MTAMLDASQLRMGSFDAMPDVIPEGIVGEAQVKHVEVSEQDAKFANLGASFRPGGRVDFISPGRYAKLYVNGELMMSDTDMELRTNRTAVREAHGSVVIGGLGLGLVPLAMARSGRVTRLTIVEKSQDVILLVEPHLQRALAGIPGFPVGACQVVCRDVETWEPVRKGRQFDYVYMDIWPDICGDDYAQHTRLRMRYRRWLKPGGRVRSWRYDDVRANR